nr:hypothetical protein [Tanacetum cinerariifolium]
APSHPPVDVARSSQGIAVAEDPGSKNASSPIEVGSPGCVYRPEWGVTNGSLLDTPEACQDLVDHAALPGYFTELRHMPNVEFLRQYNVNLARQVAMGSQLRLRFEQEAKLLKKSVAQVGRREKRIQDRELEIKNLEVLLETKAEMKRAAEGKNAKLMRELEDIRAQFSGLKVSNEHLSQRVAALQEQVSREEKLKAAFREFKWYEDDRRLAMMKCAESLEMRQAFADVVSARVAKGMSEGLKHGVEHGPSQLELESIEAYEPEAEAKFVAALQSLKDLKFSLLDQLEGLKDALMDACQDLVDHAAPPGYFAELRHMPNDEFLRQYNVNLARQVAIGSQLRLRFEQEVKLLKKSVAQVARREKRIQDRELEIKNLEVLLETEAEMKRAAEGKKTELMRELEDMRAQFSGLKVSNEHLSQRVAALQEQVSGEEKLKAAFEEFKLYEDDRVEWVIGHGLRLAMMKCVESLEMRQAFADVVSAGVAKGMSEGLKHGVEHGRSQLESIEAYDPEADAKFVAALQSLKDLKFSLLDQLEGLKDAPMD